MQIDFKIILIELDMCLHFFFKECLHVNETSQGQSYKNIAFVVLQGFVIFCAKYSDNVINIR